MKIYLPVLIVLGIFTFSLNAQTLEPVVYHDGSQKLNGLVTSNAGEKLPGVLILPAWKGIDDEAKHAALELEKEGYIALIADIYGEGHIPTTSEEAMSVALQYKEDYKAYQRRIAVALEQLKESGAVADKIVVIGICFGGVGTLEVARAGLDVAGVVSIHGGYSKDPDRKNESITTKVLIQHAANDKSISSEEFDDLIIELNEGNADWQTIIYANTGHTFTNPESDEYHAIMAKRAWNHTLLFLREVLD